MILTRYLCVTTICLTICFPSASFGLTKEEGASIQAMWWAKQTAWEAHLKDTIHQLFVCKEAEPVNDRSPCNYLVGHVLRNVFKVDDFNKNKGFLTADQTISAVYSMKSLWVEIGSAGDQSVLTLSQEKANSGYAVIALYPAVGVSPGHIALVLPGKLLWSGSWGLNVPNSASFFLDQPQKSYVGRGLSLAFSAQKKGDVRLFFRSGSQVGH